jgi:hypothetical protein
MTNYGQTSKELEEEFEREEEPVEQEYIKTFPKKFSSSLPRARLGVKVPDSMSYMNRIDSLKIDIPHSDIYNKEWRSFNTSLLVGKKRK